ncbi:MAG: hypothetical protein LBT92_01410, partial [Rickettsiales bacterium]|nr:hypothetical protein [Rickettsiales bacterium]
MMKFLMKKSTLAVIALVLLALVGLPAEVLAQSNPSTEPTSNQELGPFKTFLERGAVLFAYTRNALYVAAAFVFLTIAWKMIYEGKMANEDWAKLLYMAIGF